MYIQKMPCNINHVVVIDILTHESLFNNNSIESMVVDNSSPIMEENSSGQIISNMHDMEEVSMGNEKKHTFNMNQYATLASKFSPISHRLRSKK